jgi:hypothetical protein
MLLYLSCLLLLSPFSAGQDVAETGYNNSCLYEKEGLNRDGPKEFDCPRFVIESTDQIWNMYRGNYISIGFHIDTFFLQILTRLSPT